MYRTSAALVALVALGCEQPSVLRPDVVPKPTRGDLGIAFKSVDEAAVAGCAYIWQHEPKATEREFCGAIYRDSEGIKAGLPEMGEATYCKRPLNPPGTSSEGGYHNHRQSSEFSSLDRKYASELGRYLCTPTGVVKRMTVEGTVIVK